MANNQMQLKRSTCSRVQEASQQLVTHYPDGCLTSGDFKLFDLRVSLVSFKRVVQTDIRGCVMREQGTTTENCEQVTTREVWGERKW